MLNPRLPIRFACLLLASLTLPAQTPTGSIEGTLRDATEAVVAEAQIDIRNSETNEVWKLRSDSAGHYAQLFLRPGMYEVLVEKEGFNKVRQQAIKIDVGQSRVVDMTLGVGSVKQQVQVTAQATQVDSASATVGQVIDRKRVVDLPLNGRGVFGLANLTPGVNPTGNAATPGLGGGRNGISELQIDGVTDIAPENNPGNSQRVYEPQVDAVEEFSVQTNAIAAEYGRFGGGVINVVTKSGTNKVQGSAYEFFRNQVLDANNFFANQAGRPKSGFKRNQFGGTVGGPVLLPHLYNGKNRTFFFIGYEGTKASTQALSTQTVPVDSWKNGDFSQLRTAGGASILIYDPLTGRVDPRNANRFVRDPFPGNVIPQTRVDPVSAKLLPYFASSNARPTNLNTFANNFVGSGSTVSDSNRIDSRVDHNFTDKWRMFARLSFAWSLNQPFNPYSGNSNSVAAAISGPTTARAKSASIDHTVTLSPTLLLNVRYGLNRINTYQDLPSAGFDPTQLGFPSYVAAAAARNSLGFPSFTFSGAVSNIGSNSFATYRNGSVVHSFAGSISKITSRHTIKAGGEFRKMLLNYVQYGYPASDYTFSPAWTQQEINTTSTTAGFPFASFLLGLPISGRMSHDPVPAMENAYVAGYVQDDWKVAPRLTLNIGLRYDLETPRTERYNQLSVFDPFAPSPLQGKVSSAACPACGNLLGSMRFMNASDRRQVPFDRNNFAPRFGFAYQANVNTVLRGGYGISYAPSAFQASGSSGGGGSDGYRTQTNMVTSLDANRTIKTYLRDPFPDGFAFPNPATFGPGTLLGQGIAESLIDGYRTPYVQQWNFNIQRKLPWDFVAEVDYLGNRGVGLIDGDGGRQYDQLPASYMALGPQLTQLVPNPLAGLVTDPTSTLSRSTVQYGQLQRPYPQYTNLAIYRKPGSSSIYHGVTVRVDRRFANGVSLLMAFTGGKGIDDGSNSVPFQGQVANTRLDAYNNRLERAVSSQDISRRLVLSYVWELPLGKGRPFLNNLPTALNFLVTGWQVNGITTAQTGLPLLIFAQTNNTGIFTRSQRAANNGQSGKIDGDRTRDQEIASWFNTSVFSQPRDFTFGTTGRTLPDVRSPGSFNTDLSFFKNNYFGRERAFNVQYRCEMFNAFNHTQLSGPGTTVNTAGFGVITGTAVASRQIQMALKLLW